MSTRQTLYNSLQVSTNKCRLNFPEYDIFAATTQQVLLVYIAEDKSLVSFRLTRHKNQRGPSNVQEHQIRSAS